MHVNSFSFTVPLGLELIEICCGIAAYSTTFVFGLFYNAVHTCYADFAVDENGKAHVSLPIMQLGLEAVTSALGIAGDPTNLAKGLKYG